MSDLRIGDTITVKRPKQKWSRRQTVHGRVEQVTEHIYAVRLTQGWIECFRYDDPLVRIKVANFF